MKNTTVINLNQTQETQNKQLKDFLAKTLKSETITGLSMSYQLGGRAVASVLNLSSLNYGQKIEEAYYGIKDLLGRNEPKSIDVYVHDTGCVIDRLVMTTV